MEEFKGQLSLSHRVRVGDVIEFELGELGAPVANNTSYRLPLGWGRGRVVEVDQHGGFRATIPLHSQPHAAQEIWWFGLHSLNNIRILHHGPRPAPESICRCDSFELTWYGHDSKCPEKK